MEENKIPFPEEITHLARINAILEKALDKAENSVGQLESCLLYTSRCV